MLLGPGKLGKYQLRRRIGVGGMAEIYEAYLSGAEGFAKRLALKVLLPDFQCEPELIKSFIDEATIAAQLTHPNIVAVYDFGQIDGTYYLAMELVDGWDLRQLIRSGRERKRGFPVAAAAYIGHELAEALFYIHSRRREIVHRDVTPSNVFITNDGHVKLGDFGVAKTEARLAHTQEGQIKGKLAYLSPEQVRGDPVSNRTDIYAAGLILYELLTADRYNDAGRDVDLLSNAMSPRLKLPSRRVAAARPLDKAIEAALQPHSTMRTRDARLLAEQLASYLQRDPWDAEAMAGLALELVRGAPRPRVQPEGEDVAATEQAPTTRAKTPVGSVPTAATLQLPDERSLPRHRWPLWATLAALLLLVIGLTVTLWPEPPRRADAETSALARAVQPPDAARPVDGAVSRADEGPDPDLAEARRDAGEPASRVLRDGGVGARERLTFSPVRIKRRGPRIAAGARRRRPARPAVRTPAIASDRTPAPAKGDGLLDPFPGEVAASTRREQAAKLSQIGRRARARGLWPGDDASFDQQWRETQQAVKRGLAEVELQRLQQRVAAFEPDDAFIRRKLARLERRIAAARIDESRRRSLTARSQRILRLVLDDRAVEASRQISVLFAELR